MSRKPLNVVLGIESDVDSKFRFNSEGRYLPRQTNGLEDGVAPYFRAIALLKREDEETFKLEVEIDSKADLWTKLEDVGLYGKLPKDQVTIDPADESTHRLKDYNTKKVSDEDLSKICKILFGIALPGSPCYLISPLSLMA
ncbi:hypothetical protein OIDMADRAFT_59795 [Oidiodendron maius Zn]|uniref:Uncharacterized protein n=1 Tax=Oidiodendron maius (strain Zn) TaxID=913774 RepID=A0A0C3C8T4_OIDMZ|nr:hypothetical protein OIDMADRAFT_59795 [Oidiodendron maius Zn]